MSRSAMQPDVWIAGDRRNISTKESVKNKISSSIIKQLSCWVYGNSRRQFAWPGSVLSTVMCIQSRQGMALIQWWPLLQQIRFMSPIHRMQEKSLVLVFG